jgi:cytochrome c
MCEPASSHISLDHAKNETFLPVFSSNVAFADPDEFYKNKNCFACHRVERNHLSPSFKSIASKYTADKGADQTLAKKVVEGAVGFWGSVPMPPQTQVTQDEALTLVRWIIEQK